MRFKTLNDVGSLIWGKIEIFLELEGVPGQLENIIKDNNNVFGYITEIE